MSMTLTNDVMLEMAKAGVLFGHRGSKTHPRMKPYIAGTRNEIELLDPEATLAGLSKAIEFLKEKVKAGGLMLVVGTHAPARESVQSFAKEFKAPYVVTRWLGGTLTNFKVISDRLAYYEDLKKKKETGELAKYTKKEQYKFAEEIAKLSKFFDGLADLKRMPEVLVVVNGKEHDTAIREAKKKKMPIVAVLDTDDDPAGIDYPIFANDHSKTSIDWVFEKIREALKA